MSTNDAFVHLERRPHLTLVRQYIVEDEDRVMAMASEKARIHRGWEGWRPTTLNQALKVLDRLGDARNEDLGYSVTLDMIYDGHLEPSWAPGNESFPEDWGPHDNDGPGVG